MKVSLFEISYKKKLTFFTIFTFFLDAPEYERVNVFDLSNSINTVIGADCI